VVAQSPVLTNQSLLSRIDLLLYRVETSLALICGIGVFSLMLLAVVSVGGRNFFNHPLPGYVDWIEQIMPLIAILGVAYVQRDGGHIRMDLFVGKFSGRALWMVEFIGVFIMLLLMILLTWGGWAHFERSFDFSAAYWSRDSSMDIALPIWPAKLIVPCAFAVICARLAIQLVAYAKAIIYNEANPVAVPLIQDIATQASNEANSVSGSGANR